jgi:predicted enzyme related to lactoylglutathione lyase
MRPLPSIAARTVTPSLDVLEPDAKFGSIAANETHGFPVASDLPKEIRVCIDVDDVDRAVAFYREVFGLEPGRRLGTDWVEMLGAAAPIDLLATPGGTEPLPNRPSVRREFVRHWTPVHVDFVVSDLDATVKRAVASGATLDREMQVRPYGRMANLADPFGNGLCILEMNSRGYDALADEPEVFGGR